MKRIKMMLLSLSLIAVVGGALAFKASYNTSYCIADPVNNSCINVACPNLAGASTSTTDTGIAFKCTVSPGANGCQDQEGNDLPCVASTRLKHE